MDFPTSNWYINHPNPLCHSLGHWRKRRKSPLLWCCYIGWQLPFASESSSSLLRMVALQVKVNISFCFRPTDLSYPEKNWFLGEKYLQHASKHKSGAFASCLKLARIHRGFCHRSLSGGDRVGKYQSRLCCQSYQRRSDGVSPKTETRFDRE